MLLQRILHGPVISIHALREEGDLRLSACAHRGQYFYPRPPRGGRRHARRHPKVEQQFLSTPSARRATRHYTSAKLQNVISIHALREEGDRHIPQTVSKSRKFLSTPSARRATRRPSGHAPCRSDFYPRPPRGGRHRCTQVHRCGKPISIHALREEGDQGPNAGIIVISGFLSTPSARRATVLPSPARGEVEISIHALREEGDQNQQRRLTEMTEFLSTPSARRATRCG